MQLMVWLQGSLSVMAQSKLVLPEQLQHVVELNAAALCNPVLFHAADMVTKGIEGTARGQTRGVQSQVGARLQMARRHGQGLAVVSHASPLMLCSLRALHIKPCARTASLQLAVTVFYANTPSLVLRSFTSESMDPESTMVYAYYKEGSSNPTFLYPKYALKEEKC